MWPDDEPVFPNSPGSAGDDTAGSFGLAEESDGSWANPSSDPAAAVTSISAPMTHSQPSSSSGVRSELQMGHGQRMSYENFLASAISRSISESAPKFPWEQGIWAALPSHLKPTLKHHSVGVGDLFVPSAQPAVMAPTSMPKHSYPDFVRKRLRLSNLHRDESEVRALQLRKLRTIVLQDPSSSELGCALVNAAGALQDEEVVARSFRDAFVSKSTGTLLKRVSSLWSCCCFLNDKGVPPLDFQEEILYEYLSLLREQKRGATAASSVLSAIRFIHGVVKIKGLPKEVEFSSRCEGLARGEMARKRPTKQSEVLTADQVWALEKHVVDSAPSLDSLIGGQDLFALYSCARWDDSLHLADISLSSAGRIYLVETATSKHKTSHAARDRSILLPLICLGRGLYHKPWADAWLASRRHFGLDSTGPALPTYCERTGKFGKAPMSSTEATLWLRDLLCKAGSSPSEVEDITSHGLKATLLSWISKLGGWSERDQKLMGHHFDRESRSVLIYSRDSYTPLAVQTRRLLDKILDGSFSPDRGRARRVMELLGETSGEEEDPDLGEYVPSESGSEPDLNDIDPSTAFEPSDRVKEIAVPESLASVPRQHLYVHNISGIMHASFDLQKLLCGRPLNRHYSGLEDVTSQEGDVQACKHCSVVFSKD
ncbi:unnamed protein product [Symbiodinium sp. CCMP2592]|nr:unnamed protein product [Symbiodinium sp. CCMP2592]